jgi:hypothetical protein
MAICQQDARQSRRGVVCEAALIHVVSFVVAHCAWRLTPGHWCLVFTGSGGIVKCCSMRFPTLEPNPAAPLLKHFFTFFIPPVTLNIFTWLYFLFIVGILFYRGTCF